MFNHVFAFLLHFLIPTLYKESLALWLAENRRQYIACERLRNLAAYFLELPKVLQTLPKMPKQLIYLLGKIKSVIKNLKPDFEREPRNYLGKVFNGLEDYFNKTNTIVAHSKKLFGPKAQLTTKLQNKIRAIHQVVTEVCCRATNVIKLLHVKMALLQLFKLCPE